MEIYLYGTSNEVSKAQAALKPIFPDIQQVFPIFDLPDTPEQIYCRISYKCLERGNAI